LAEATLAALIAAAFLLSAHHSRIVVWGLCPLPSAGGIG
jgi:hypothetical protein